MPAFGEPTIIINGLKLSEAQAMSLRVAVTHFHNEVQSAPTNAMLGEIGPLYRERLTEVLLIMGVMSANGLFPMG